MNHFHTIENTFASLEQYSIAVRQLIKTVPGKLKTPTQPSNNRANTIARNFNNNKVLKKALEHFENNTINQLNESINHFLDRLDFPVDVLDKINYFNQKYARIETIKNKVFDIWNNYLGLSLIKLEVPRTMPAIKKTSSSNVIKKGSIERIAPNLSLKNFITVLIENITSWEYLKLRIEREDCEVELHLYYLNRILSELDESLKYLSKNKLQSQPINIKIRATTISPNLNDAQLHSAIGLFMKKNEETMEGRKQKLMKLVGDSMIFLNGFNNENSKRIKDDDFERLKEYAWTVFVYENNLGRVKPITQVNMTNQELRYHFYKLYKSTQSIKKINRNAFIEFLYTVFPNAFKELSENTMKQKFSAPPIKINKVIPR